MNDSIDWYDYDQVKNFKDKRTIKFRSIMKKKIEAREKNDSVALSKANKALLHHISQDKIFEKKAGDAGFSW